MRIAVYSGSFDPLHIGHLAVMRYLSGMREFGRIYLVISPQNPMKSPEKALNAEQRYSAAVASVMRHPELRVTVDDIELHMPHPNYTINTLDALKKREPQNEFTLVIGADNLQNILKWKDATRILGEYGLVVYPRTGYDMYKIRQQITIPCSIELIDAPIVDISSTEIREREARGEDMSAYLM